MNKKTVPLFALVLLATLIISACTPANSEQSTAPSAPTETAIPAEPTSSQPAASDTEGAKTIRQETKYQSPAGEEPVAFKIVVDASGVITSAETEVLTQVPISKMRQESFGKELPAAIVGKKLSEIEKLDRVGGSSLTTGAFNQALTDLKAQL